MSEHQEKLERIMDCVNRETAGIDVNDRAMILLLLQEFIKCAIFALVPGALLYIAAILVLWRVIVWALGVA